MRRSEQTVSRWTLVATTLGCLTLLALAPHASGNEGSLANVNQTTTSPSAAAGLPFPMVCTLFRNGFELKPDLLFHDGFEIAQGLPEGPGAPIHFVTSGGYTIDIDLGRVKITDPLGINKIEHAGFQNEYFNGKHIKNWGGEPNWDDDRRSLILGDGTKVTLVSQGYPSTILQTSIYDGDENLQIDNRCNTITHRSVDPGDTAQQDQAQYDGEAATFETDPILGSATYSNAYDEDRNFNTINIERPLGLSGGFANPTQVQDFYDDPRLGHT